jgi:hypothetical protein
MFVCYALLRTENPGKLTFCDEPKCGRATGTGPEARSRSHVGLELDRARAQFGLEEIDFRRTRRSMRERDARAQELVDNDPVDLRWRSWVAAPATLRMSVATLAGFVDRLGGEV